MSDTDIQAQTQLAGFWTAVQDKPGRFPVMICDKPFTGLLNLRGESDNPDFLSRINNILGADLPQEPNRYHMGKNCQVCWLAPNEWMIIAARDTVISFYNSIIEKIDGFYAATIVSSAYQKLSISGANTRELLAKGCPVDFHPDIFRTGYCIQSRIAKTGVFIVQIDNMPTFDIYVRRSFSDYLVLWLLSAADEYGFNIDATEIWKPV